MASKQGPSSKSRRTSVQNPSSIKPRSGIKTADPKSIAQDVHDQWMRNVHDQKPLNLDRAFADLTDVLKDRSAFTDERHYTRARILISALGVKYRLPRFYRFFPRDSVPAGASGYDEAPHVETHFTPREGQSVAPNASGFGAFNPGSGLFQIASISTGNQARVIAGPTVTIQTTAAIDAVVTLHALVDYSYTASSSPNPRFSASNLSAAGYVDAAIAMRPIASCLVTGAGSITGPILGPIGFHSVRVVTVDFDLTHAPYKTASGHENRVARYDQGSDIAVPVELVAEMQLPANARCTIGMLVDVNSFAVGAPWDTRAQFLGFGDVRASGRFLSIEVAAFEY